MSVRLLVIILALVQGAVPDLPTLVLPLDDGAWVIRIVTSGGFAGRGAGNLTTSSAGEILCVAVPSCPARLVPETTGSITRLLVAIPASPAPARRSPLTPGTCSDCVKTTMTIRRREPDGERTITYEWDASTAPAIPVEVLRLHAAIESLAASGAR